MPTLARSDCFPCWRIGRLARWASISTIPAGARFLRLSRPLSASLRRIREPAAPSNPDNNRLPLPPGCHVSASWRVLLLGRRSVEICMNATETTGTFRAYDVVILGAGYAGLMAALRLCRKRQKLRIALINASDRFLERVRLQESIVTEVIPRIPSIASFTAGSNIEFVCGTVTSLDANRRCIRIASDAPEHEIMFDEAIYALGSRVDVDGVPGAAEHAYRLEAAEGPRSPSALRTRLRENAGRPIRVVTVGGAETAIEVAGEIKTAWPNLEVTMVTRSRCAAFKDARVESAVCAALARLGVKMIDRETVAEVRSA